MSSAVSAVSLPASVASDIDRAIRQVADSALPDSVKTTIIQSMNNNRSNSEPSVHLQAEDVASEVLGSDGEGNESDHGDEFEFVERSKSEDVHTAPSGSDSVLSRMDAALEVADMSILMEAIKRFNMMGITLNWPQGARANSFVDDERGRGPSAVPVRLARTTPQSGVTDEHGGRIGGGGVASASTTAPAGGCHVPVSGASSTPLRGGQVSASAGALTAPSSTRSRSSAEPPASASPAVRVPRILRPAATVVKSKPVICFGPRNNGEKCRITCWSNCQGPEGEFLCACHCKNRHDCKDFVTVCEHRTG